MHRAIAAFLVLLTLLLPALGSAGGVAAAASATSSSVMPSSVVLDEAMRVAPAAVDPADRSTDGSQAGPGSDVSLVDGPSDMPVLLESPKAVSSMRPTTEPLPAFVQGDAPSPYIEGLRRPPRHVLVTA